MKKELTETKTYQKVYADCQAGGMNETNSHEIALEHAEKAEKRNQARRDRDQVMRDLGMTKVRGNLGGTYWE